MNKRKSQRVRFTKIQYRLQVNRYSETHVPVIRIHGLWLREIGFKEGQTIKITLSKEKMILTLT
jgi:toxic protein SymE